MKLFSTSITAINPITGHLTKYCGPNIPAISWKEADYYCQHNGLGYCKVDGELIAEIPCKDGTYEPDFGKTINYDNIQNN
jgi:hypothetical protein